MALSTSVGTCRSAGTRDILRRARGEGREAEADSSSRSSVVGLRSLSRKGGLRAGGGEGRGVDQHGGGGGGGGGEGMGVLEPEPDVGRGWSRTFTKGWPKTPTSGGERARGGR